MENTTRWRGTRRHGTNLSCLAQLLPKVRRAIANGRIGEEVEERERALARVSARAFGRLKGVYESRGAWHPVRHTHDSWPPLRRWWLNTRTAYANESIPINRRREFESRKESSVLPFFSFHLLYPVTITSERNRNFRYLRKAELEDSARLYFRFP